MSRYLSVRAEDTITIVLLMGGFFLRPGSLLDLFGHSIMIHLAREIELQWEKSHTYLQLSSQSSLSCVPSLDASIHTPTIFLFMFEVLKKNYCKLIVNRKSL